MKSRMSARNKDIVDWMENDEWFIIDDERNRFILTTKAPERARRCFEKYKQVNNLDWDDPPIEVD